MAVPLLDVRHFCHSGCVYADVPRLRCALSWVARLAVFETHVPAPVVTVTPSIFNEDILILESVTRLLLNITNFGLIAAENLQLQLPSTRKVRLAFKASLVLVEQAHHDLAIGYSCNARFDRRADVTRQELAHCTCRRRARGSAKARAAAGHKQCAEPMQRL